jgi:hypothetical protein
MPGATTPDMLSISSMSLQLPVASLNSCMLLLLLLLLLSACIEVAIAQTLCEQAAPRCAGRTRTASATSRAMFLPSCLPSPRSRRLVGSALQHFLMHERCRACRHILLACLGTVWLIMLLVWVDFCSVPQTAMKPGCSF